LAKALEEKTISNEPISTWEWTDSRYHMSIIKSDTCTVRSLAMRRVLIVVVVCVIVGALAWAGVYGVNVRQRKEARLREIVVQFRARSERLRNRANRNVEAQRRGMTKISEKDEMSEKEVRQLDKEATMLRRDLRLSIWQKVLDIFREEEP
jgi:hypothetical protein